MTDNPENVTVEQCDADAAAELIEQYWRGLGDEHEKMHRLAQRYRAGHVQGVWAYAFARHRLANQPPRSEAEVFTATTGIRRQRRTIDGIDELLRLINGGAILAEITRGPALTSKGEKP